MNKQWKEVKGQQFWFVAGSRSSGTKQGMSLSTQHEGQLCFGGIVTLFETHGRALSAMKRTKRKRPDWSLAVVSARVQSHQEPAEEVE